MKKTLLFLISVILAFFLVGKSFAASPVPEGYEVWRKMVTMFYSSTTLGSLPMGTSHYLVIDENGKVGIISSSDTTKVTFFQNASLIVTISSTNHSILTYQGGTWTMQGASTTLKSTVYQSADWIVTINSTTHSTTVYPGTTFPVSFSNPTVYVGSGTAQIFTNSNVQNKYKITVNSTTYTTIFSTGTVSYGEYILLQNSNSSYNMLTSSSTDSGGEFGFIPPNGSKIWDEMNIPCNIKLIEGASDSIIYGEECSKQ